ncbi:MAG TPA: sensor domain-containing diguanylate cyclase [Burkholderiaceae bacterium]|nr:sensor domain-containing diguanylate cyclase [Burkholderiaceae bacterium]
MNHAYPNSAQFGDLMGILPDAVLLVDERRRITYVNQAVRALLGYAPDELLGEELAILIPPALRARHEAMVAGYQRHGVPTRMGSRPVLQALHRDGRLVPVSISLCNWTLDDGQHVSVAVLHDATTLHTHLDRANELAETDALTGLGNRLRLSNWMQQPLADARPFSLLYMDLRHFKRLNDTLGHAAGDRALQIVARRLQAHVRAVDLVVRLGGDEFVVALDALADDARLALRARAIAETVRQPVRVEDAACELGANIGGAIFPRHGRAEAELLAAADRAMYGAKQDGQAYRLADDA